MMGDKVILAPKDNIASPNISNVDLEMVITMGDNENKEKKMSTIDVTMPEMRV